MKVQKLRVAELYTSRIMLIAWGHLNNPACSTKQSLTFSLRMHSLHRSCVSLCQFIMAASAQRRQTCTVSW